MDADRFDSLARSLTATRSRRSLTRLFGGLGLGGVLSVWGAPETRAAKRNAGEPCIKRRQCRSRKCVGDPGQKTCGCSEKFACGEGASCLHGGCFRSESCATGCATGVLCGSGCYCSATVGGVPVCFKNEPFCGEGEACETDDDCRTGRVCVDVSCVGCGQQAVCLTPCPVAP